MKKMVFATLSLACMFGIAGTGASPAAATPTAPHIGACRWSCPGVSTRFTTAAACDAVCPTECDAVC
jgi:hypothetical protein